MKLIAQAILSRQQGAHQERLSTLQVIVLDAAAHESFLQHVVTLQIAHLIDGVAEQVDDSTLTPMPVALPQAQQRAMVYLHKRLAAGDTLVSQHGFDAAVQAAGVLAAPQGAQSAEALNLLPESTLQTKAIAALCAKLDSQVWRRLPSEQQGRLIWRLSELADPARAGAGQQQLYAQVPRLVTLLGSGDDLLDYCLAALIGKLGDTGAAVAMQALSERGRSAATRDMARQAWLALQPSPADESVAAVAIADPQSLLQADEQAQQDPKLALTVRELLAHAELGEHSWPAIKRIYKRAQWRHDHALLAVLHARFDGDSDWRMDGEVQRATLLYMRLRGWRHLRRLAAAEHSQAPALAVALLQQLDRACAAPQTKATHRVPETYWLLAHKLLLPRWPGLVASPRAWRWRLEESLNFAELPAQRVEGLAAMWDAHPQHLLALVAQGQSRVLLWSLTRALRDQTDYLRAQAASAITPLLRHAYAPAAALGLELAQRQMASTRDPSKLHPWLQALAQCPDGPAADFLSQWLTQNRSSAAADAELVASLLVSPAAVLRTQGVALLVFANGAAVSMALLAVLPTLDEPQQTVDAIRDNLVSLWTPQGPLAREAGTVPALPLHRLLTHSLAPLVEIATAWLLVHPAGLASLPPSTLRALLASDEPVRVACGIRLMDSLPDQVLAEQAEVLADFAVSIHPELRQAVAPLIGRLAANAPSNTRIADVLHDHLFRAEAASGVHADVLALLTGPLAAVAPARDPSGVWRALQARTNGAQRYGAWALQALGNGAYTLRQWATLARHADAQVRSRSRNTLDALLEPIAQLTPEQAEQLLPLADAKLADTQRYAQSLFGERLPDAALTPELLIAWVDHPQAWVQALGRQRLTQHMSAPEASLCLTRLAQHPSTSVQLFVTQWLLSLPDEPVAQRAARLQELAPYFLAVLSQVHRARASKTRVLRFLRSQTESEATAAVVAGIFARQVVSASLLDQPDYVAGLRDIVARHPQLAQSFMQPVRYEERSAARATAANRPSKTASV
ncbi:hypothetical protein [Lampropedia aestuarii]|uniref:hypothetical protein n=1 Tax=Lampropedia aestuarii TaxID=2562762 RepID=UPI001F0DB1C3|nr:hypothetical protein [Lampropedia aestuarii]